MSPQTKASNNHPWVGAPALTPILDAETISLTREGRMLIPDVMTPAQFFNVGVKKEPEHLFLLAILIDAVECISKPSHRLKDKLAAIAWFDDETNSATVPFNMICEVFGFEPSAWRRWAHAPHQAPPRHIRQMAGMGTAIRASHQRFRGVGRELHVVSIG